MSLLRGVPSHDNNVKAMEWMKENENTEVVCKEHNRKYKYSNGYFTSYIYGIGWKRIPTYYKRLPETSYEEAILRFFDEKQWCSI